MMTKERAFYLIEKSFTATLTAAEQADFEEWLLSGENQEWYVSVISELMLSQNNIIPYENRYWQPVLDKLLQSDQVAAPMRVTARSFMLRRSSWMAVAAILLLLLSGSVYWLVQRKGTTKLAGRQVIDVAPGHQGAVLTLADGRMITLDSVKDGVIATENGAEISVRNGALAYNGTNEQPTHVAFNTISTPVGRQFQLSLPDGSRVWLNAASSLRYPVHFSGKERSVEITGEAYFEVAAKADMPFRVATPADGVIEVLGTSFDINAYSNEPVVATTLVNGAVRVRAGAKSSLLSPGQQARVKEGNDIQIVSNANIQQVVAWKEGIFDLQNRRLDEVMRQLARWYDIEVVYEKEIPSIEFYGEMGTNLNLSQVLKMLEGTGVKFRMEGTRKLVVMP